MKYYTRRFTENELTLIRQVFEYYLDSNDSNGDDEAEEFYDNELQYEDKKYI
jgi:hypothetical protein